MVIGLDGELILRTREAGNVPLSAVVNDEKGCAVWWGSGAGRSQPPTAKMSVQLSYNYRTYVILLTFTKKIISLV